MCPNGRRRHAHAAAARSCCGKLACSAPGRSRPWLGLQEGKDGSAEGRDVVLYFGIIDILTVFDVTKRLEVRRAHASRRPAYPLPPALLSPAPLVKPQGGVLLRPAQACPGHPVCPWLVCRWLPSP